jgi:hybrid polyketide synthase/nonribosomal peptide synthetase ACE1
MAPISEPIAIIGTGCRFPGGASQPSKLWSLLQNPHNVASRIPNERFNIDGFYHRDGSHHGTTNVQESYFLEEDHRRFDAQFFNIQPAEADSIDPQQRVLLETVYEGIEAAGLQIKELQGSSTAVYVGLMNGDYSDVLFRDMDSLPTYTATATARSIMSNRISYFFDWHGPSMTIDTACSSSLVALHHAVQTLRSGDSRVAVAAGANLIIGPGKAT